MDGPGLRSEIVIPQAQSSVAGAVPLATTSLGIERAHYVALGTSDPPAASRFAQHHMGLDLVHVDDLGRHYLAGKGLDAYSLVYVPGDDRTLDHLSYLVADVAALHRAAARLDDLEWENTGVCRSDLWRHGPSVRFRSPTGYTFELTVGANISTTMASLVFPPEEEIGTITSDHAVIRTSDVASEIDFASRVLGLYESSRIEVPSVGPALTFFRARTLYHCLAIAQSASTGVHHQQLTLKDGPAVFRAYETIEKSGEAEMIWGPVRHGPGHNIAFYIRDFVGNYIEFSAEEEVILNNDSYRPQIWSIENHRSLDEWGSKPPKEFFQ